ncbi:MAG: deoxynucleoside kinase [Clostridia bacterium]|nr:deoxynucleoside kinase [Clostridia bacterium]
MKYFIIEIEGTDGSGKQTQTKKLFDYLKSNKLNVKQMSFPNYESLSSGPVRMYLQGNLADNSAEIDAYQASVLFASDRLCTMKTEAKNFKNNDIIILDRYAGSNLIHQACKISDKKEREIYANWITDLEFNKLKIPKPDLVLFLDMPIDFILSTIKNRNIIKSGEQTRDIHERDEAYLNNVYKTSKSIAESQGWYIINCDTGNRLKTIAEVHSEIIDIVNKKLISKLNKKI